MGWAKVCCRPLQVSLSCNFLSKAQIFVGTKLEFRLIFMRMSGFPPRQNIKTYSYSVAYCHVFNFKSKSFKHRICTFSRENPYLCTVSLRACFGPLGPLSSSLCEVCNDISTHHLCIYRYKNMQKFEDSKN